MNKNFYTAFKERRSYYNIGKESSISDEKILNILEQAVKYSPTAFNSQSSRAVLLLNENHNLLWDITVKSLEKILPKDKLEETKDRILSFKNGYGTILFFEDQDVIKKLEDTFLTYKHNFQNWSREASGMFQFVVWTSLCNEALGASLQHYNELIEDEIKSKFNIKIGWKLISQMPFGEPLSVPDEKSFEDIKKRVLVYK